MTKRKESVTNAVTKPDHYSGSCATCTHVELTELTLHDAQHDETKNKPKRNKQHVKVQRLNVSLSTRKPNTLSTLCGYNEQHDLKQP